MEGTSRWLTGLDFSAKLKELYTTGDLTDVDFLVGNPPIRLKGHRFVLAMASEVFRAMFYGSIPENVTVKIEDVEHDVFQNILQYIYTGEMSISSFPTAIDTAYACQKYLLTQTLFDLCMLHAETFLDVDDVWDAYHVAILLEDSRLRRLCKYLFVLHAKTLLKSKEFLQCSTTYLNHMIADIAGNVRPILLFRAMVNWAMHQEGYPRNNLRSLLEPFLPHFRFLSMKSEQLARCVGPTGLLKDCEYTAIVMEILRDRGSRRSPTWLNPQRAIAVMPLNYRVNVVTRLPTESETSEDVHLVFSFQILNTDAFLKGVCWKVDMGCSPPSEATVKYVNHTKNFSTKMEIKIEEHRPQIQPNEFVCHLKKPRLLEADDEVTVSVHLHSNVNSMYFTYTKGEILEKRHDIQDGKVVIKSIPLKDSAPLSAVVLSPVL